MEVPKEKKVERITFEEIMAKDFSNLMKDTNLHIKKLKESK